MTARTRTFQGLAPETRPKLDSESPKSGIRIIAPLRVPRPAATGVERSAIVPPPPESKRAAVKQRAPRAPNQEAPSSFAPAAPPIPTLAIPALAAAHELKALERRKPSRSQLPSLITTAQDWVLVKPPAPASPKFGVVYRDSMHSLPPFLPPAELLGDAPPVTMERISVPRISLERISEGELEIVRSRRAMRRRERLAWIIAGFSLALLAALVVIAFTRG